MTRICPKCGYARQPCDTAAEGECPRCGIVYAKYAPRVEPVRSVSREADAAPAAKLTLEGAVGVAAAACAALLAIKGTTSRAGVGEMLLLVPFFFCFVPVLSYTFGDGLYLWNKHRMRFDLYDSEAHPVLSKVFFIFFAAAAVTFAVFLFKLGK